MSPFRSYGLTSQGKLSINSTYLCHVDGLFCHCCSPSNSGRRRLCFLYVITNCRASRSCNSSWDLKKSNFHPQMIITRSIVIGNENSSKLLPWKYTFMQSFSKNNIFIFFKYGFFIILMKNSTSCWLFSSLILYILVEISGELQVANKGSWDHQKAIQFWYSAKTKVKNVINWRLKDINFPFKEVYVFNLYVENISI